MKRDWLDWLLLPFNIIRTILELFWWEFLLAGIAVLILHISTHI